VLCISVIAVLFALVVGGAVTALVLALLLLGYSYSSRHCG
jgi:multisubunit Na+/H+ antiporter MnhC subunit